MRSGAIYSALLHVAIVALVYFGLPNLFDPEEAVNRPIPVAVYVVSDETTLPPATPEPEPEPAKEPPPPPEPEKTAELPPAPEPIEVPEPPPPPEPVAEKTPPPEPAPEPTPEPLPSPIKAAEPDPEKIPPPPPPKPVQVAKIAKKREAEAKPKPKPEPDPPDFSSLLVDLASKPRTAETPDQKEAERKSDPENTLQITASTRRASEIRNEPLSLSVIDAIRRQVENKWNPPIGALDAKELSVEIRIVLQTNGAVRDVQVIDKDRMQKPGEENFRALAESAERAVWRASPLQQLPPEKYDQWQQITLTFKPPV